MTAGARSGQGPETPGDGAGKPNSISLQHHELLPTSHFSSPILFPHCSRWGLNPDPTGEEAAYPEVRGMPSRLFQPPQSLGATVSACGLLLST